MSPAPILRDHIHLDTTLNGGVPVATWKTVDRQEIPVVFMGLERTLTGRLVPMVAHQNGQPLQLTNMQYVIRVTATSTETLYERKELLKSFNGKRVYLVDHYHCEDTENHAPYVRRMICQVGSFSPVGPGLPFFLVEVYLEDDSVI